VGNFVCAKIKIRGENDEIFGWGFLIWMSVGTKHVLSADHLFLYEMSSRSSAFLYSFKIYIDFPSCFGVNHGIETGGMQCSDCVSM
jgi:hypothetical protein